MRNPLVLGVIVGSAVCLTSCAGPGHHASHAGPLDLPHATPATPDSGPRKAEVERAIAGISPSRAYDDIEAMVAFGTRHTYSAESPTRGLFAAQKWVGEQFKAAATNARSLDVTYVYSVDTSIADAATARRSAGNVVATFPGSLPESQRQEIWVLAHLDSRASDRNDATSDAPGANDDASGVAVLLEIARALGSVSLDHTVILAATSGEEQGLYGAAELARDAKSRSASVRAVLNNDMVGDPIGIYPKGSPTARAAAKVIRVFSHGVQANTSPEALAQISALSAESDSPARQLARYIADIGELYDLPVKAALVFRNDRFLRGGDHTAFLREGFLPCVRFTMPYEDYDRQHQDVRTETDRVTGQSRIYGDTLEWIDPDYLAGAAKLNLATVMHLANAPTAPADARIITAELDNATTLRWSASPEPDVVGYEIVVRPTTSPVWTAVYSAGHATETTLDLCKDNVLFGVRAVDRDGYRSLVSFAGSAKE